MVSKHYSQERFLNEFLKLNMIDRTHDVYSVIFSEKTW